MHVRLSSLRSGAKLPAVRLRLRRRRRQQRGNRMRPEHVHLRLPALRSRPELPAVRLRVRRRDRRRRGHWDRHRHRRQHEQRRRDVGAGVHLPDLPAEYRVRAVRLWRAPCPSAQHRSVHRVHRFAELFCGYVRSLHVVRARHPLHGRAAVPLGCLPAGAGATAGRRLRRSHRPRVLLGRHRAWLLVDLARDWMLHGSVPAQRPLCGDDTGSGQRWRRLRLRVSGVRLRRDVPALQLHLLPRSHSDAAGATQCIGCVEWGGLRSSLRVARAMSRSW